MTARSGELASGQTAKTRNNPHPIVQLTPPAQKPWPGL